MRVLLINQFVPPEGAPTAKLLADLQDHLTSQGWQVHCIGATSGYRDKTPVTGARRMIRDLRAHLTLLARALRAPRCDWVLCLTDPPALPFTAGWIARLKRARFAHWAMDVYPQVALALQALPDGRLAATVRRAMAWGYRRADLLVALDLDMARQMGSVCDRPIEILAPWPPTLPYSESRTPKTEKRQWLYSGNLGRAHLFETLLETQALLEQQNADWQLTFQGGGPRHREAQQRAHHHHLSHCAFRPYAPESEVLATLLAADALVATQRPETLGLLWPSKLALLKLLKRPLIWIGPTEGAIAHDLRTLPFPTLTVEPGQSETVATWLQALPATSESIDPAEVLAQVAVLRQKGLQQWEDWLSCPA